MTTQWGRPLTGEQMVWARLSVGTAFEWLRPSWGDWWGGNYVTEAEEYRFPDQYRLPADHAAYTLLEAGWLDGRNVALWFGGDKAPDDWDGGDVLLQNGEVLGALEIGFWWHDDMGENIIAYIAKVEGLTTHADRVLADAERAAKRMGGELGPNELWGASGEAPRMEVTADVNDISKIPPVCHSAQASNTVTIAKMTEAEARERISPMVDWDTFPVKMSIALTTLEIFGLIKPEPTREERFWSSQPNGGAHVTDEVKTWVRDALDFEQNS